MRPGPKTTQPVAETADVSAPLWLSTIGRDKWAELIEVLRGRFRDSDRDAMAMYCESWADWCDASKELEESGLTCTSGNGTVFQSPHVGIRNKAFSRLVQMGDRLGLNPRSREKLAAAADFVEDELELLSPPGEVYVPGDDGGDDE